MQTDVSNPETSSKRHSNAKAAQPWPVYAGKLASSLITTSRTISIDAECIGEKATEINQIAAATAKTVRRNQRLVLDVAAQLMAHPNRDVAMLGIRLAQIGDAEEAISQLQDIRSKTGDLGQTAAGIRGAAGDSAARIAAALVGEYWRESNGDK